VPPWQPNRGTTARGRAATPQEDRKRHRAHTAFESPAGLALLEQPTPELHGFGIGGDRPLDAKSRWPARRLAAGVVRVWRRLRRHSDGLDRASSSRQTWAGRSRPSASPHPRSTCEPRPLGSMISRRPTSDTSSGAVAESSRRSPTVRMLQGGLRINVA